jgi:hypothetical protein
MTWLFARKTDGLDFLVEMDIQQHGAGKPDYYLLT